MRWHLLLFIAVLAGAGCAGTRRPGDAPAEVLRAEDRRVVDASLRQALRGRNAALRARAVRALGRMRLRAERATLEAALGDPDPRVRGAAATALALLADPAAVSALTGAARDADASVRAAVVEALGQAAATTAGSEAVRAALGDPDAAVARAAALATWRLPDGMGAVDALAAAARSGPLEVRRAAAYALGRLASAGVGPPSSGSTPPIPDDGERARVRDHLLPLVPDGEAEIRMQVARGLAHPARPVELEALASLAEDEEARVRVHAARSLAWEGAPVEPTLARLLRDDDPLVIHAALEGLGRIGTPEARALLVASVAGDGPGWLRAVALDTLAALDAEVGARRAVELQEAPDRRLRAAAARALGARMPDALLSDPELPVRAAAIGALAAHDPLDPRLESVATGSDPILRASLAEALGTRMEGDDRDRALARLRSLWDLSGRDPVPDARDAILDAAARAGREPQARALLTQGLADREWLVRRRAAEALERVFEEDHAAAVGAASARSPERYAAVLRWAASPHAAVFRLEDASFTVALACEQAPLTCLNFACLANDGFYDGLALHRVVPSFVIQDGDPRGDGSGGPGWSIRDEVGMGFEAGTLGMASAGYDTPGSQWFVTSSAQPHLDLRYTAFGTVTEGFAAVPALLVGDRVVSIRVDGGATAAPCGPGPRWP